MSVYSMARGALWASCALLVLLFVQGIASSEPAAKQGAVAKEAKQPASSPAVAATTADQSRTLPSFLVGLYIFLLAIFAGIELITKVPPTLHTPLMSGSNAISGITIVGALYCARFTSPSMAKLIGFFAVIFAMINVVGGFVVTDRLLQKFKKKGASS
jgi:NAD(P) transhydrogenase subunit alpha